MKTAIISRPADEGATGWTRQETDSLLETMAAVLAHEIANPIAGISTSLQLVQIELERKQFNDPLVKTIIRTALREIARLRGLLDEFRSPTTPRCFDLKSIQLEHIIEEIVFLEQAACRGAGIRIELDFEEDLPAVKLDAEKIKQAVLNL